VTGGLAGFGPHAGGLVLAATILYAALLCVAGGWLGVSVRFLARAVRGAAPASEMTSDEPAPAASDEGRPSIPPRIERDADLDDVLERKEAHHV
jgi:hypothetical protein